MEVALYFPNISLPNDSWFTRILLYWDGIASVVPRRMSRSDPELTPFMSELLSAKLVRPLRPREAKIRNLAGNFDYEFLELLDSSGLPEPGRELKWTRLNGRS